VRRAISIGLFAALLWSSSAFAQSDRDLATRQDFIARASTLADQGKHADALAMAKRAAAVKMTPSLRLFIATEEVALGLLAEAYGNGRQCVVEAGVEARLNNRDRILADCTALETSLAKRVGHLTIKLPTFAPLPTPANVRVTVGGEELNAAIIGEPYVVSPGKIAVTVTATGYLPYQTDVVVAEGAVSILEVKLAIDINTQPCPHGEERVHGECVAACALGRTRTLDDAAQCCWEGQSWNAASASCTGAPRCPPGLVARNMECFASIWTPGYHKETHPREGLIIAGATVFGVVYLLNIATGAIADAGGDSYGALYVPGIGPFIQLAKTSGGAGGPVLVIDGILQLGGIAMFAAAFAAPKTESVLNKVGRDIHIAPVLGRDDTGLTVVGSF